MTTTVSGNRRRRCVGCNELKPPNPDHRYMCPECVVLHQAGLTASFAAHREATEAAIKARTDGDHIQIAHAALRHPRRRRDYIERGVHACEIVIDADTLEWLLAHAEGKP